MAAGTGPVVMGGGSAITPGGGGTSVTARRSAMISITTATIVSVARNARFTFPVPRRATASHGRGLDIETLELCGRLQIDDITITTDPQVIR